MKKRFERGEGEIILFTNTDMNSLRDMRKGINKIVNEEKKLENQFNAYSSIEKKNLLQEVIYKLSNKLVNGLIIDRKQLGEYVESNIQELSDYFPQYHAALSLIEYLDKIEHFKYRINTTKSEISPTNENFNKYGDRKNVVSSLLSEMLSQSVYYVDLNGSSQRLILYNIKSKNTEDIPQKIKERIFYTNSLQIDNNKEIIKVDSEKPNIGNYIFEISSPDFSKFRHADEDKIVDWNPQKKSSVGIIRDDEGIYINACEGSELHYGWRISNILNLKN